MKELGLKSRNIKKYKATTNSKRNFPVHENMLDRATKFSTIQIVVANMPSWNTKHDCRNTG
ncbi:hypothetical protein NS115_18175 [Paenibacillus jamilae]|uniref:Uncharacterized protein n=1 Tax=Paenibacillus jamilae TaxID=114136 RepID=A0ACC4ZST1_9BACL|nr:hypothetical protein [Paenibacillus polymyxa]AUO09479.1 hypothetical protein C0638_24560 [Paenibacillus sp. lzh-N1]KTS80885.1 hypothetical protein NS115_18175 [Paenibacillus jamilae]